MYEEYQITQNTRKNSSGNNIGVQNNYMGISPEKAIEITNKLFYDNFPKLKEEAFEIVTQRITELETKLFEKLSENPNINYSVFADPDMQYVLFEAEKMYARIGNSDCLDRLCSLIETRMENNKDDYLKLIIDSAIQITPKLSSGQINYLTIMFLLKRAHFNDIKAIEDLSNTLNNLERLYGPVSAKGFSLLHNLGCFDFYLGNVEDILSKKYSLDKNQIVAVMPADFKSVSGDYFTSDIGTVIAISNINVKENNNLKPKDFIKY